MFTTNPFVELSELIPQTAMQVYIIFMFLMVIGGTLLDVMHKKSAQYFFENAQKAQASAKREVSSGEKTSLAIKTVTNEVLTSSEFQNPKRRLSHLLTMYGFVFFVVSTVVMIMSSEPVSSLFPFLWHLGAIMLCVGGYWFWFSIRVDVSAEGKNWYEFCRADIFIVSLLAMATFGLLWSITQGPESGAFNMLMFYLFILSSTTLFSTVLWSKFAHMFFKPMAAYQKKITKADGSQENLPDLGDLTDPALQAEFPDIPEYMGAKPSNMGLGIKRESPNHY
jgi:ABC-type multidrug transport system fused ATPase/permease subunit